jgi:hypothetical protein
MSLPRFPLGTALAATFLTFPLSLKSAPEDAPVTLMARPLKILFEDALNEGSGAKQEIPWRLAKGKWTRSPEGMRVAELAEDKHGAVGRIALKLQNFILSVDIRLDGAKSATISINDAKEHVARFGLSPNGFMVRRDDHDHEGPDRAIVFFNSQKPVETGVWHTVILEMVGDTIVGTLDGKQTGWGSDELLKVEKANPGLTVAGESASFRNLRIWEAAAEPKEGWREQSQKLPVPNTKPVEPTAQKKPGPK